MSAPRLATAGSEGNVFCSRGAGSLPDQHPSAAPEGRSAQKCTKKRSYYAMTGVASSEDVSRLFAISCKRADRECHIVT